jgi:amino acid adenylation domain-containing protein
MMYIPPSQRAIQDNCYHPSGEFVTFGKKQIEQSVSDRFEQQVARHRSRLAVKTTRHELTYDELNRFAHHVARAIFVQRGDVEEPIALLLEQGATLIATILGALRAGKTYVPLDPSYPRARISYVLRDSQARLILTNYKNLALARALAGSRHHVVNIDQLGTGDAGDPAGSPISPDRLAFILYTSGSTGQPKGVMQSHRNLLHEIMNYTNGLRIGAQDRVALISSFSFVDSVRATYGALLNGAALYPFDIKEEGLAELATWLIQQEITICRFVPTVFRHFCSILSRSMSFPKLRLVNLSGEPVDRRDVELCREYLAPDCVLVNSLGSTESLTSRWYFVNKDVTITGNNVPVGYAVQDMAVTVLDEAGDEVGLGQIGEIAVKSQYLSPGYWRSPDLTHAKFLADPERTDQRVYLTGDLGSMSPDGCLVHQGRKDFQVKIRGHRVEPGEIEAILGRYPVVEQAAVVAQEGKVGNKRLVAYVVASAGSTSDHIVSQSTSNGPVCYHETTEKDAADAVMSGRQSMQARSDNAHGLRNELLGQLRQELPGFMVPSDLVFLDSLPLTPNGKADRQALLLASMAPPKEDGSLTLARTPVEKAIAEIWAEVLGLDQVGVHDDFLQLGGNSLLAMQVVVRILHTFGEEIPAQSVLESATVEDMAILVTQIQAKGVEPDEMDRLLTELEALSLDEAEHFLSERDD